MIQKITSTLHDLGGHRMNSDLGGNLLNRTKITVLKQPTRQSTGALREALNIL